MDQANVVTLQELLQALQKRGIPLPYEIGTFITLQACERILHAPAAVDTRSVLLAPDGEVVVSGAPAADQPTAVRSLLHLLTDLLVRSAQGLPGMLLELVELGADSPPAALLALRDELEAALVPLNRAATMRVLSRILREARRADRQPQASLPPQGDHLVGQFDRLLGGSAAQVAEGDGVGADVDLESIIYTAPAPAPAANSADSAMRLQEDYGHIREHSRAMTLGLYASATGLVATMALLWYVMQS